MRHLTSDELWKIRTEEDLLKGNINRMCVTEDLSELDDMFNRAVNRLKTIYDLNYKRISEEYIR